MDTLDDVDIDDDVDTELEVDTLTGKKNHYLEKSNDVQITCTELFKMYWAFQGLGGEKSILSI